MENSQAAGARSHTQVDAALTALLDDGRRCAERVTADAADLWEAVSNATEGGKRFRPALLMATYTALDGQDRPAAAKVAAAVELLHTAFVIHDDLIDGDHVRRGRPNVSGGYAATARDAGLAPGAARRLGDTAAVLAGDLALTTAVRAVATCGAPPQVVSALLDLVERALHASAAGELADVSLALGMRAADLDEVIMMEELKTSAYSFELPLQAAAVLAGAPDPVSERLREAGRALGIAFQLRDDLLGVFGDPRSTGKSTTSDLREGKQTALVAYARTTSAWKDVSRHLGRPELSEEEADEVRQALTSCGARRFVEALADEYSALAVRRLQTVGLAQAVLGALRIGIGRQPVAA